MKKVFTLCAGAAALLFNTACTTVEEQPTHTSTTTVEEQHIVRQPAPVQQTTTETHTLRTY